MSGFEGLVYTEAEVRDIIEQAIETLGANADLVKQLTASRPAAEQDSIITALTRRDGRCKLSWGRDAAEDWTIHVMLTDTRPLHTVGGVVSLDYEESLYDPSPLLQDAIVTYELCPLTIVGGIPAGLPARGRVRMGGEVSLYEVTGSPAEILLTHRGIDYTTAEFHSFHDPVIFHRMGRRIGWGETRIVRVDVVGSNAVFLLDLATILKAWLILSRGVFETRGLTLGSITETDMAPRPIAWPADLMNRTLTLELKTECSAPDIFPIITDVLVHLTVIPPGPAQVANFDA